VDHLPGEEAWQLATPISQGEFVRQPYMRPSFFGAGLALLRPDRSQITVQRRAEIAVSNPHGAYLLASYKGPSGKRDCTVSSGGRVAVSCDFPAAGSYTVQLFHSAVRYGRYDFVGQLEVNAL